MKVAFLANPTVGHTNFLISLAKISLLNRDDICFYLPGVKNKLLIDFINNPALKIHEKLIQNNIPFEFLPFPICGLYRGYMLGHKRGFDEVMYALKFFKTGAVKLTKYLKEKFTFNLPDIIVYDYTFFPAIYISELLKIPRVAVYHSGLPFLEYPIPPIGTTVKYNDYPIEVFNQYENLLQKEEASIKQEYKTAFKKDLNTGLLLQPNGSLLNIVNTVEEAEYPRKKFSNLLTFCGPNINSDILIENRKNPKSKKIIYISLGTVFNNQPSLYKRIIESIPINDYELIVSAGKSYDFLKKQNFRHVIRIEKFVNQIEELKKASLFISHGGKNSINESIALCIPMILFPAGGEQEYNAALVEYLKCGINFSNKINTFGMEQMLEAINKILHDKQINESIYSLSAKHQSDGAEIGYNKILHSFNENRIN